MNVRDLDEFSANGMNFHSNGKEGLKLENCDYPNLKHCIIRNNLSHGIKLTNSQPFISNSSISYNAGGGILSNSSVNLNFATLSFNSLSALMLQGNNFHNCNNSILWGNDNVSYKQISLGGGVLSSSYSTIQGQSGYGVGGTGQFYWGDGILEADPLFADGDLYLQT